MALIKGERRGPVAALLRGGLSVAALGFRLGGAARAAAYDGGLVQAQRAPRPVISVGNLTAGGTGKTPLVIHLARALLERGERPAVLARGYGADRDGALNDELRLIAREVPDAILAPGRDRAARALEAAGRGATALLLDDGFQHRQLRREVDLVLLDATDPWGPGGLLPRGLLREPPAALARAHVVVLSRVEFLRPAERARLEEEVRATGFQGPIVGMRITPGALVPLPPPTSFETARLAQPPGALAERPVLAACGIGNPAAFGRTLEALGARVLRLEALPDHHGYTAADVARLEALARELGAARIVTTAKDAVKLEALVAPHGPVPWATLEVAAELDPPATTAEVLDRALGAGGGT
ncbi:MAG: tetraacyldisaccharide 4'-kinase [Planctomycetes bacterium]|nr:tetraacyldisaccharide 4'-kinase [Planctomycetota bacterium]